MSNEQRDQQQTTPAPQPTPDPRREFAKKGALTVVSALVSGAARAVVAHLLTDTE
ncbi:MULTISPECIES: hypothetical protein [unclassified Streptomyces]|uniref:hypothetical protein n=1 Tax=unclassified Streptomyces TaxID=2593676 RepID=UPI00159F06B3|nr:hypothetical protein [Streptomyces sp. LUP30]